jgi:hypothetical protein
MSLKENDTHLEYIQEEFEEAMSRKDYARANSMVDRLREHGLDKEADVLFKEYMDRAEQPAEYSND